MDIKGWTISKIVDEHGNPVWTASNHSVTYKVRQKQQAGSLFYTIESKGERVARVDVSAGKGVITKQTGETSAVDLTDNNPVVLMAKQFVEFSKLSASDDVDKQRELEVNESQASVKGVNLWMVLGGCVLIFVAYQLLV